MLIRWIRPGGLKFFGEIRKVRLRGVWIFRGGFSGGSLVGGSDRSRDIEFRCPEDLSLKTVDDACDETRRNKTFPV